MRWLHANGYVRPMPGPWEAMDYGYGRGDDARWLGWPCLDPEHRPEMPAGQFQRVTCIYVLNVLPRREWAGVLWGIRGKLQDAGLALIAVRRDIGRRGQPGVQGVRQTWVRLDLPVLKETCEFCIYRADRAQLRALATQLEHLTSPNSGVR